MQLMHQGKGAAPSPKVAAPSISHQLDEHSQLSNLTPDDAPLLALRRQFAQLGLSLYPLGLGDELAIVGAGVSRSVPDRRCAWLLLRHLQGGAA